MAIPHIWCAESSISMWCIHIYYIGFFCIEDGTQKLARRSYNYWASWSKTEHVTIGCSNASSLFCIELYIKKSASTLEVTRKWWSFGTQIQSQVHTWIGCKITVQVDQKLHILLHLINWMFNCLVSFLYLITH